MRSDGFMETRTLSQIIPIQQSPENLIGHRGTKYNSRQVKVHAVYNDHKPMFC